MLTVFREMAHSLARQLAHLDADKQRLGRGVTDERAGRDPRRGPGAGDRRRRAGGRAHPEQLEVLRESGVVDAGGYGLVLILAGVVAGLRGDEAELPEVAHHEPPRLSRPHHEDSRFRYCTNFIVSGSGLAGRDVPAAARGARRLGARRRRRGDAQGPRPHRRARGRGRPLRGRRRGHQPRRRRHARADRRARRPAAARGRTGVVAVAAGDGHRAALRASSAPTSSPGGETLNPSTYELLAGIHEVAGRGGPRPAQLLQRDHGRRARLRALREAGPGGPRRPRSRRACWPWSSSTRGRARRRTPSGSRRRWRTIATGGVAPAARDDAQGRFRKGDAVGFADGEIVAWGGAGSTLAATIERLAEGAEIVTVIGGEDAPIPLDEIDTHVPDGVEIETHEGGQPSWWWLLAAQ